MPPVQYSYNPGRFDAVTQNSEDYKAWPIEKRAPPPPPPLRPTLPFEGACPSSLPSISVDVGCLRSCSMHVLQHAML